MGYDGRDIENTLKGTETNAIYDNYKKQLDKQIMHFSTNR